MKTFLLAAEPVVEATSGAFNTVNLYNEILIVALVVVMLTLLFSAVVVHRAMKAILRVTTPGALQQEEAVKLKSSVSMQSKSTKLWNSILGLRPIEEEKDLVMEHEFDGIRELDNPVPLWFNTLFYSTVIFGICYFFIYQVFGWGLNQDQEYALEMEKAEIAKKEYLAQSTNLVDESSVVFDASMAAEGKSIFMANCVACHGGNGEGGIGPNLTDKFWIHGGAINDIFRTVKYGVPDKGMVPWEQTLTPGQIAEVSSYIMTLQGTNPANGKAPEGVEVSANEAEPAPVVADSLAN